MTRKVSEKLNKAKDMALKNPPKELKRMIIDDRHSRVKKSATKILLEMRYGCRG